MAARISAVGRPVIFSVPQTTAVSYMPARIPASATCTALDEVAQAFSTLTTGTPASPALAATSWPRTISCPSSTPAIALPCTSRPTSAAARPASASAIPIASAPSERTVASACFPNGVIPTPTTSTCRTAFSVRFLNLLVKK